jgi:hypothetical protein
VLNELAFYVVLIAGAPQDIARALLFTILTAWVRLELTEFAEPGEDIPVWRVWPAAGARIPNSAYTRLVGVRWLCMRAIHAMRFAYLGLFVAGFIADLAALGVRGNAPSPAVTSGGAISSESIGHLHYLFSVGATLFLGTVLLSVTACGSPVLGVCNRRVLLLRPFGERKMSRQLRKLLVRSFGRVGHVYMLSDRNYRPIFLVSLVSSLLSRVSLELRLITLFVLTPLLAFKHTIRISTVKDGRGYLKLNSFMLMRFKPNLLALLSMGQTFNIRCTDDWWQTVVLSLMYSSDVIVVDVSSVKGGIVWELDQIKKLGLASRSIFVAGESHIAAAKAYLAQHFCAAESPAVLSYGSRSNSRETQLFISRLIEGSGLPAVPDM